MPKILIIDDDVQVTKLLKKYLSSAGYEVMGISDSSKAIKAANLIYPDLIILDLMMPQPDGFQICQMLRADPNFSNTPILIITAMDISNSDATIFGANGYLAKPFNFDELISTLEYLLDGHGG
jgi:DNA-binding response OmpR family regulator